MQITLDTEKISFWTLKTILGDDKTPVEILESLSSVKDGELLATIALNKNISRKVMETLSEKSNHVVENLASNQSVPGDILDKIAKRDNYQIHKALLTNPNTKTETLKKLYTTLDASLYPLLMQHPNVPDKLFANIFNTACENYKDHARDEIFSIACESNKLTYDMIKAMLKAGIKSYMAEKLVKNEAFSKEYVFHYIKENLYEDYEYESHDTTISIAASDPYIEEDLADILIMSGEYEFIKIMASNAAVENLLMRLAGDPKYAYHVVRNDDCPREILRYIYKKFKAERNAMDFEKNPNCPKIYIDLGIWPWFIK